MRNRLTFAFFLVLSALLPVSVFAILYEPGETLNPACAPGDLNCGVVTPATSGANTDITSLSNLTSVTSTDAFFSLLRFVSASGTSITSTNAYFSALSVDSFNPTNIVTGNVTSTNLYVSGQASFGNLSLTNVTTTALSFSSAIGGTLISPSTTIGILNVTSTLTLPAGSITDAFVVDGLTISGGTINNTPIGAVVPSTGIFTHVTTTAGFTASGTIYLSDQSNNHRAVQFLSDDSYGDYMISQGSFPNSSGRDNQIFRIGFNKRYGGVPPGEVAFGIDFESYYLQADNDPVLEAHLLSIVDTDGSELRPLSFQYHYLAGTTTMSGKTTAGFKLDQLNFHASTATVEFASLRPHEFGFNGVGLQQNTNDFNWLRQMNAAEDGTVEIARVDGDDRVRLSPGGAQIYIPLQSYGALGIGTTSTYSMVNIGAGPNATSSGIGFQGDVNLYRQQANVLATDDVFTIVQPSTADGLFLSSADSTITAGLRVAGSTLQVACKTATCNRALFGVGGITQSLGSSIDTYSTGLIIFYNDDAAEGMRLTAGGNLLVGTTVDNGRLSVSGTAYISNNLRINTATALAGLTVATTSNFSDLITFNTASGTSATTTNFSYGTASGTTFRATSLTVNNAQVDGSILVGATVPGRYINFYDTNYGITAQNGLELKTADAIQFLTGTTQRMVIDSNGDVGIGINSLNAAAKLQFTTSTIASGGIAFGSDTNLYRSGADTLQTDDSFVVAGTVSSTGGLFTYSTSTNAFFTHVTTTNFALADFTQGSVLFASSSGRISEDNSGLFFDSTNNRLGIGTTSPLNPLHVNVNQNANTTIRVSNGTSDTAAQADFRAYNSGGDFFSVGIYSAGTTAYGALTARSAFNYAASPAGLVLMADNALGTIRFAAGGSAERMRIDPSGRLGIGTTNPTAILSLNTSTAASGGIAFGSDTNLYRSAANVLSTDDSLVIGGSATSTNFFTTALEFTTALGTSVTTTNNFVTNLAFVNATGTHVSSTNLFVSNNFNQSARPDPVITGRVASSSALSNLRSVYVSGKYAYVASQNNTSFAVIDISDPLTPTLMGQIKDASKFGFPRTVSVLGKYAYVTSETNDTLTIIDISDPHTPIIVGGIEDTDLLDGAYGLYISGKYAYVTSYTNDSLSIINISNPTGTSTIVGRIRDTSNLNGAQSVYVSGKYAYVGNFQDDSLRIIDISDPSSPIIVGGVKDVTDLDGVAYVYVSGKYAYVTNQNDNSLRIIDIASSTSPTIVGGVKDDADLSGAISVQVAGKYAYVTNENDNSLRIIDIASSTSPTIVGGVKDDSNLASPNSVFLSGKYAYLAVHGALAVIDIGGIDAPSAHIGALQVNNVNVTENFSVANNAYISNALNVGSGGIKTDGVLSGGALDMGVKINPTIVGSVVSSTGFSSLRSTQVVGKNAYVFSGDWLQIVDISIPQRPTVMGGITSSTALGNMSSGFVAGRYAYITAFNERLSIVDVSNPTAPSFVGSVVSSTMLNGASSVHVSGRYAYVTADVSNSFSVIDITNPVSPMIVGAVVSSTAFAGIDEVFVSGRYAYVTASGNHALHIIDISNPTTPTIVGSVRDPSSLSLIADVYVSGKYAYVITVGANSLVIIDVEDSSAPIIVGSRVFPGDGPDPRSIFVSGKYAYVADSTENSLFVVDISSSTAPSIASILEGDSNLENLQSVYVSGKYAYVISEQANSFSVIDIGGIDAPSAHIGALQSNNINVTENLTVANDAYISNGLVVGAGGIKVDGGLSVEGEFVYMPNLPETDAASVNVCYQPDGKISQQADCSLSSARFKHDIEDWNSGLSTVMQLRTVSYKRNFDDVEEIGLIAEEVDLVDKRLVIYDQDSSSTPRAIDYKRFVVPLISAVQAQQAQIDGLMLAYAGVSSTSNNLSSEEAMWYETTRPAPRAVTVLLEKFATGASVIKEFVAERVVAAVGIFYRVKTEVIEVDTGIQMTDAVTGDIYCVRVENGQLVQTFGSCEAPSAATEPVNSEDSTSDEESIVEDIVEEEGEGGVSVEVQNGEGVSSSTVDGSGENSVVNEEVEIVDAESIGASEEVPVSEVENALAEIMSELLLEENDASAEVVENTNIDG